MPTYRTGLTFLPSKVFALAGGAAGAGVVLALGPQHRSAPGRQAGQRPRPSDACRPLRRPSRWASVTAPAQVVDLPREARMRRSVVIEPVAGRRARFGAALAGRWRSQPAGAQSSPSRSSDVAGLADSGVTRRGGRFGQLAARRLSGRQLRPGQRPSGRGRGLFRARAGGRAGQSGSAPPAVPADPGERPLRRRARAGQSLGRARTPGPTRRELLLALDAGARRPLRRPRTAGCRRSATEGIAGLTAPFVDAWAMFGAGRRGSDRPRRWRASTRASRSGR